MGGSVGGGFPPTPLTAISSRLPSARSTLPESGRLSHKMFDSPAVHFMTLLSQLLCRFRPHLPWHDYDSQVNVSLIASRFVQSSSWSRTAFTVCRSTSGNTRNNKSHSFLIVQIMHGCRPPRPWTCSRAGMHMYTLITGIIKMSSNAEL